MRRTEVREGKTVDAWLEQDLRREMRVGEALKRLGEYWQTPLTRVA